eukprot:851141-Amphidinium_carterae.2
MLRQVLCSVGTVGGCSGEADGHATFQIGNTKAAHSDSGVRKDKESGQCGAACPTHATPQLREITSSK